MGLYLKLKMLIFSDVKRQCLGYFWMKDLGFVCAIMLNVVGADVTTTKMQIFARYQKSRFECI